MSNTQTQEPGIPYPVLNINGIDTVLVPVANYREMMQAARHPGTGFPAVPEAVARLVADGANPLAAWREHRGFSQEQLAEMMGVSRGSYSQMERKGHKPRVSSLVRAAKALGIDLALLRELYDGEEATVPSGWTPPSDEELD